MIVATYRRGISSDVYISTLDPILAPRLGGALVRSAVHLYTPEPVPFPSPAQMRVGGWDWSFVPVVLEAKQVAVAARHADQGFEFLKIYSPTRLVEGLGLTEGCLVNVEFLSGVHLDMP